MEYITTYSDIEVLLTPIQNDLHNSLMTSLLISNAAVSDSLQ